MAVEARFSPLTKNNLHVFLLLICVALIPRIVVWALLPVDWNWDSYHHWQISYLTLKIGLSQGRMWDLNGCEYYWGMVPHLAQAFLLWVFSTASMLPYRAFNVLLGGINAYIVYLIGSRNFGGKVGLYSGILFGLFPIAVIFDVVAMQETMALLFALLALNLFDAHPFLSGVSLALAAQSRIEFWLVSLMVLIVAILAERASNRLFPFVLSWLLVTGVFCWFFLSRTGNALYPLYYNLYNVFGGWSPEGAGKPLLELATSWITSKLMAWPTKPTGIILLGTSIATLGLFTHMVAKRWEKYPVYLFFMACLTVFGPIFVPYFTLDPIHMMLMLRMSITVAATGFIVLIHLLTRRKGSNRRTLIRKLHPEKMLILVSLLSFAYFVPAYGQLEKFQNMAFDAADEVMRHYGGGTIVCDYPTMNYRFVSRWHVSERDLLGNHYSPAYYGISDPIEFARWFRENNITLWIYIEGESADRVWEAVGSSMRGLLIFKCDVHSIKIFVVDKMVLEKMQAK